MVTKPELQNRIQQHYVAIRTQVSIPFGKFLPPLWDEVHAWLGSRNVSASGPALIRYLRTDMSTKLDIDVGFGVSQAVSGDDRVIADVLPSGRYATLLYTGPYKGKGIFKATVSLLDWAKENKIVWDTSLKNNIEWWNGRVEWYLTDPQKEPDTKKYKTELAFLIAVA
jgi:effector-binding domain-containing protein